MRSIGLALGGGSVRGAAHLGVLREISRLGISVCHISATSSGAVIGALAAAGCDLAELERVARTLSWHQLFEPAMLLRRNLQGHRILQLIEGFLGPDRTFDQLDIPLAIAVTDLGSGQLRCFEAGPVLPALRAAIALPGLFRPSLGSDGEVLVDGGVLSVVPVRVLVERGCAVTVAVDVARDTGEGTAVNAQRRLNRQAILCRAAELMTQRLTAAELALASLVLRPNVGHVNPWSMHKIAACIDAGAAEAQARAQELLQLCAATPQLAGSGAAHANESIT